MGAPWLRRSRSDAGTTSRSGKRRGIGIANYIEFTTGAPREWTKITVLPEGRVDVAIGTLSSGQGHRTSFAQLVTDWLGVPFDCVNLIQGDTDIVPVGGGSHSGRSMRLTRSKPPNTTSNFRAAIFSSKAPTAPLAYSTWHARRLAATTWLAN